MSKPSKVILSAIISFVYFFLIYSLLKLARIELMDTVFMMSLYTFPFVPAIYYINFDAFNKLLEKKTIIIGILTAIPVIIFIFSLFTTAPETMTKEEKKKQEESKKAYEIARPFLDADDFLNFEKNDGSTSGNTNKELTKEEKEDLTYKKYADKILKEEDGKIYQYEPVEPPLCINKAYEVENGYIYTCTAEESQNYYAEKKDKDEARKPTYYKLNIDTKYLDRLVGYDIVETQFENSYKKEYEFGKDKYIVTTYYSTIQVYKEYTEDRYLTGDKFQARDFVEKDYKIRSWYDQANKITFITEDFCRYEVTFELLEDLTLKAVYSRI